MHVQRIDEVLRKHIVDINRALSMNCASAPWGQPSPPPTVKFRVTAKPLSGLSVKASSSVYGPSMCAKAINDSVLLPHSSIQVLLTYRSLLLRLARPLPLCCIVCINVWSLWLLLLLHQSKHSPSDPGFYVHVCCFFCACPFFTPLCSSRVASTKLCRTRHLTNAYSTYL